MSLLDLFKLVLDEAAAEEFFVASRWLDGIRCPHCESPEVSERASRKP